MGSCKQLFRERLVEKMCTRQSRKLVWDMINTLFVTTVAVEPTFVVFQWHLRTYVRGLSCHSFKFFWRTGRTKSPTIPFGIVACTFSDNRSQNSCIQEPASTDYLQTVCNAIAKLIEADGMETPLTDNFLITIFILLHEKFLHFDWLRAVVFLLNLKYLLVKITNNFVGGSINK